MHRTKLLLSLFFYLTFQHLEAQYTVDSNISESDIQELKALLKSKQLMMASLGLYQAKPAFLKDNIAAGTYRSVWYQDSYFIMGYGQGKYAKSSEYAGGGKDTLAFNDLSLGLNFAFKKRSVGHRLWDINGALLSPQIGVCYNNMSINNTRTHGVKIIPALSLQLPYFAIDARLNMDLRSANNPYTKGFSIYPEIGIRLDGLFNVLDPTVVSNGHYEGTRSWKTVSIDTHLEKDDISGDLYDVTVRTETTHTENYNFDSFARNVGPFVGIGPRVTYSNLSYSGDSRMYGLGFYGRMPMAGIDIYADMGKIGFASSYKKSETIIDPKPHDNAINKEDKLLIGTYGAKRIGARVGLDIYELIMRMSYHGSSDAGVNATKFTRLLGGVGGGYAFLSNPTYSRHYAAAYKDSLNNVDYTLLTTPVNDARAGENTTYISFFVSAEVGAVQLSWEWYRYKYAPLANVRTMTVTYMLPYQRLLKRYRNLNVIKKAARK